MNAPSLTLQQAEALLAEVAAEHPERVVRTGCYAVHGQPSCLVGHVLHRAGWTVQDLDAADHADAGSSCAVDYLSGYHDRFAGLAHDAAVLLHVAQIHQDDGAAWSEAAATALAPDPAVAS